MGVLSTKERPLAFTLELARDSVQRKAMVYDAGDTHYDCASALIKSISGSDVDAGLYWLARMLEGGEDVMFLARRLVILASEDIGNADPQALMLATAAMQATQFVGLPECQLTLSQAVIYLALAPKSNACTTAIGAARRDVREKQLIPVPRHLQDKHYAGAKRLGRGEGYAYAHNAPDAIASQDYLGVEKTYYEPTDRGLERQLAERLAEIRRRLRSERPEADYDSRGGGDDGRESERCGGGGSVCRQRGVCQIERSQKPIDVVAFIEPELAVDVDGGSRWAVWEDGVGVDAGHRWVVPHAVERLPAGDDPAVAADRLDRDQGSREPLLKGLLMLKTLCS